MLSTKLHNQLNDQITFELYSEHLYLAMAAYLTSINLDGFAHFFIKQGNEERGHAMKFFKFINDKGKRVTLTALDEPKNEYKSIIEVIEASLKHEQMVTKRIDSLMDLAIKENEHSAVSFLQWFVDEQVEEELNFEKLLHTLKMVGEKGSGILILDKELGKRE